MSYLAKPAMSDGSDAAPVSVVRLLVAADSETRAVLRNGLDRRFEISEAATIADALSLVRARWFGAVVVDYELDDASRVSLLEGLSEKFPQTHRILISRRAVANLRELLDDRIVELFLAKPIDADEFSSFFRST
jgi:DNA-binding NtrC family response regulator